MLGAMRHQKALLMYASCFISRRHIGGRLLLYVELFPDFLAFVFYQYEVEAGLEAFAGEVLEVPGWEGVLRGSAEARAEVAAGREDGDGGLWRQTPEGDS